MFRSSLASIQGSHNFMVDDKSGQFFKGILPESDGTDTLSLYSYAEKGVERVAYLLADCRDAVTSTLGCGEKQGIIHPARPRNSNLNEAREACSIR